MPQYLVILNQLIFATPENMIGIGKTHFHFGRIENPAPEKSDYPIYYVGEPEPIIIKTKMGTLGFLLSAKYM